MSADRIFYENEEIRREQDNDDISCFLNEFYRVTGVSFANVFRVYDISLDDYFQQLSFIRYFLITTNRKHLNLFYEMLKESSYDLRTEIMFFVNLIGRARSEYGRDSYIEYASQCPIIDTAERTDDGIFIGSEYGSIKFNSIFSRYKEGNIAKFINDNDLTQNCHNVSWELMSEFEKSNLIVSLIKNSFSLQYYHSCLGVEDEIIDIRNGIFAKKDNYDKLYQPKEILVLNSKKCESAYQEAIASGLFNDTKIEPKALIVALHQDMKVM